MMIKGDFVLACLSALVLGGSCRFAEEVVVVVWSKWPDST
jgi:hypothetical protein